MPLGCTRNALAQQRLQPGLLLERCDPRHGGAVIGHRDLKPFPHFRKVAAESVAQLPHADCGHSHAGIVATNQVQWKGFAAAGRAERRALLPARALARGEASHNEERTRHNRAQAFRHARSSGEHSANAFVAPPTSGYGGSVIRRALPTFALLAAVTAGAAGCTMPATPSEGQAAPLTADLTFAAVVEQTDQECPAGDATAFDTSWPGEDGAAQCTFVDPDEQFTVTSGEIELVVPEGEDGTAQNYVTISLDDADATVLAELTETLVDRPQPQNQLAIIIDGEVESMPAVMEPIVDSEMQISGGNDMSTVYDKLTG